MHWAVADGRHRYSGSMSANKIEAEIKERALVTNKNTCPRCSAALWRPERDYKLCVICGWMQEINRWPTANSKRGFLDHAYAGFIKDYKQVPLRVIITHGANNMTRSTYRCPIFVNDDHERRCNEEMERHTHGLRGFNGKIVLNCLDRHRIVLSGSTWTLYRERPS